MIDMFNETSVLDVFKVTSLHVFANVILWVVISYFFFEFLNLISKNGFSKMIESNKKTQPLMGAMMGSIPGSGAPIFLLQMYKNKTVSFATLTAGFIATMGEVAFILIVQQPILYLWMVLFSFIVALIIGYGLTFINIDSKLNLKPEVKIEEKFEQHNHNVKCNTPYKVFMGIVVPAIFYISWALALPSFIMEIIEEASNGHAFAFDDDHSHEHGPFLEAMEWYFFIAGIFLMTVFISKKTIFKKLECDNRVHFHKDENNESLKHNLIHISKDTFDQGLYIFVWVYLGMMLVELPFHFVPEFGSEAHELFLKDGFVIGMIILGTVISIIPGCGPNLIFTTWILTLVATDGTGSFAIPFAVLISNSMAQDGDAGFPMLASDKKAYMIMKGINITAGIIFGMMFIPLTGVLPGV